MAGMSGVGSFLAVTGCFSAFAACVIHCVGFGTSHWLEGDGYSPFVEIGLFRACFDKCTYPFCPAGDNFIYDGCWKLWDEHFMELWTWMKPGITNSCRHNRKILQDTFTFSHTLLLFYSGVLSQSRYKITSKMLKI